MTIIINFNANINGYHEHENGIIKDETQYSTNYEIKLKTQLVKEKLHVLIYSNHIIPSQRKIMPTDLKQHINA